MKVRVGLLGETFDTETTPCPKCGKKGTNVDSNYGVLPCDECKEKMSNGHVKHSGKSINSKLEHFATPLWKVAGLKPTKEEREAERKRKWEGKSHLDLQKERLAKAPRTYRSDHIKEKLFKGELKGKYD